MPSLQTMVSHLNMSFKSSFETHLKSEGFDVLDLWSQIDDAIISLTLKNEEDMSERSKEFGVPENFFELVRFDFLIDENLEIHLMEVNMSPNLTPTAKKFEPHGSSYEQVTYNALHCAIGIDYKTE